MKAQDVKPALNPDKFKDVCEQTGVTLSRYMIELNKRGVVDNDLNSIMQSISEGTKVIASLIQKAPLRQADLLGLEGEVNVQGEDQKKLDVITNEVLKNALRYTGKLGTLASEEEDNPVAVEEDEFNTKIVGESGSYVCVFDPLDGSSNVDAGIPVGTIFGIFKEPDNVDCDIDLSGGNLDEDAQACLAATLQPGKNLVAAGYVFYSASTEFVVTFGQGVVGFTLDKDICDYKLTRPEIKIPARGKIYSVNQANMDQWDEPMRQWITDLQQGKGQTGVSYTQRYIGSMVGDVHRTLLYGGVFAYPADTKNQDGKLRLLYEAAPMSFLLEQAGGKSITGHSRVMDIPPVNVHQRVPIILGSPDDIDECYGYYDRCTDPALQARCEARLKGASA
jgi:fructose-1,6-bisphosphatase I